jgi:hypothetical protein
LASMGTMESPSANHHARTAGLPKTQVSQR